MNLAVLGLALSLAAAPAPQTKPAYRLDKVVKGAKAKGLPKAAKQVLQTEGAVVVEGHELHFFALYDRNAYEGIPSFVTLDAVLHVFHIRFDALVADIEQREAQPALKDFASEQLARALALLPSSGSDERIERLVLYHAIPLALLGTDRQELEKAGVPPKLAEEAWAEVDRIHLAEGQGQFRACPEPLQYLRFKPRGHYERGWLSAYFRAYTFYSECTFDLGQDDGVTRALDVQRLIDE